MAHLPTTAIIVTIQRPPQSKRTGIRLTRDLIDARRHMKVSVHDHVIVGAQGRSSMKALGLI